MQSHIRKVHACLTVTCHFALYTNGYKVGRKIQIPSNMVVEGWLQLQLLTWSDGQGDTQKRSASKRWHLHSLPLTLSTLKQQANDDTSTHSHWHYAPWNSKQTIILHSLPLTLIYPPWNNRQTMTPPFTPTDTMHPETAGKRWHLPHSHWHLYIHPETAGKRWQLHSLPLTLCTLKQQANDDNSTPSHWHYAPWNSRQTMTTPLPPTDTMHPETAGKRWQLHSLPLTLCTLKQQANDDNSTPSHWHLYIHTDTVYLEKTGKQWHLRHSHWHYAPWNSKQTIILHSLPLTLIYPPWNNRQTMTPPFTPTDTMHPETASKRWHLRLTLTLCTLKKQANNDISVTPTDTIHPETAGKRWHLPHSHWHYAPWNSRQTMTPPSLPLTLCTLKQQANDDTSLTPTDTMHPETAGKRWHLPHSHWHYAPWNSNFCHSQCTYSTPAARCTETLFFYCCWTCWNKRTPIHE